MRICFDSTQQPSLPLAPHHCSPYTPAPDDCDDEYFTTAIRAYSLPSMHHSRDIKRTRVASRGLQKYRKCSKPFSTERKSLQINVQKSILSSSLPPFLSLSPSASPFSTCLLIKNVNDLQSTRIIKKRTEVSRLDLKSPSRAHTHTMLDCSRAKKYMVGRGEGQESFVQLCRRDLGNQRFENADLLISSTISTDGKTRSEREN